MRRVAPLLISLAVATVARGDCPGSLGNTSEVPFGGCSSYQEQWVDEPLRPASVPKKKKLMKGVVFENCDGIRDFAISTTYTVGGSESESVSGTGELAQALGAEATAAVKDLLEFSGTVQVGQSTSSSYEASGTFEDNINVQVSQAVKPGEKLFINFFRFVKTVNFTRSKSRVGTWYDANGCNIINCKRTNFLASGVGYGNVVNPRAKFLPCQCTAVPVPGPGAGE